jgi:O-antigen/teichoic acid export membrane protein
MAVGAAASQGIVAVIYIFAARSSEPSSYGLVVAAIALGMALSGFVDFGTNNLWVRELASGRLELDEVSGRAGGKLVLVAGGSTVAVVLVAFLNPTYIGAPLILFAVVALQTSLVPLRAEKKGITVALLLIAERVAAAVVFGLAWIFGADLLSALVPSLVLGSLMAAVGASLLVVSKPRFAARPRLGVNPWTGARHYGISTAATAAQQLDVPLLSLVAGPAAAGVYGAVNRWTQPIGLAATAFSSAAAPFVAGARSWGEAVRVVLRSAWMLGVAVLGALAIIITAPWLVVWLLGDAYTGAAPLLQLLALGTIPAILNQPLATALQARRHDRVVALLVAFAVALQLFLVAVLGASFGALAAGVAFCALQFSLLAALSLVAWLLFRKDAQSA